MIHQVTVATNDPINKKSTSTMNALVYNTFHHPFPYTTAQAAPEIAINPVSKTMYKVKRYVYVDIYRVNERMLMHPYALDV